MHEIKEKHPYLKYIFYVLSGLVILFGIGVLVIASLLSFTPNIYHKWAKEPVEIFNEQFRGYNQEEISEKDVGEFVVEYTKHVGIPLFTLGLVKISLAIYGLVVVIVGTRSTFTHDLLWVYFINNIFSTLLESGALFILVFQSNNMKEFMEKEMTNATDWYNGQQTPVNLETKLWDIIHIKYNCCGVKTCDDYSKSTAWNKQFITISNDTYNITCPQTCCQRPYAPGEAKESKAKKQFVLDACLKTPTYNNSFASKGCKYNIHDEIKRMISIFFILWSISLLLSMTSMYVAMGISGFLAEKYLFETRIVKESKEVEAD
jgi:hypothetical protein